VAAHEPEALVHDVEDAGGVGVPGTLGLGLQDAVDQLVLAIASGRFELQVAPDLAELRHAHLAEIADLEVVALLGGFELLLLLEFADGRAIRGLGASSGSAIALAIALVGAGSGHLYGVTCG
jgi:hypothetical protein